MSLQDVRYAALTAQGFSGADNDMLLAWAQFNGATSSELNDALLEVLHLNGATSIALPDAWYQFLILQGFSGSFPGMEYLFWLAGGSLSPISVFNAPLISTIIPTTGTFTNFSRGDENATLEDFESLTRAVRSDEARFVGTRNVKNELTTQDFSDVYWTKTSLNPMTLVTAPDGTNTAYLYSPSGGGSFVRVGRTPAATREVAQNSLWVKLITAVGVGNVIIYDGSAGGVNILPDLEVGVWKRFTDGGNDFFGFRFAGIAQLSSAQNILHIWQPQQEIITDQAKNAASEDVTIGKLSAPWNGLNVDAAQSFTTENGNTVGTNGLINESVVGANIPDNTLKGLLIERSSANLADTDVAGTQTIATPGTGDWTISCKGTETFTITLGTPASGSISDNICSEASPAHLNLTAASTIIITADTVGTIDIDQEGNNIIQCENQSFHTSFIPSSGTGSVIRLEEEAEFVLPAAMQVAGLDYTIRGEFYLPEDGANFSENHYLCSVGSDTDRFEIFMESTGELRSVNIGASIAKHRKSGILTKGRHRFAIKYTNSTGRHFLFVNGTNIGISAVPSTTQDMSNGVNKAIWIGSDINAVNQADFPIKLFEVFDELIDDADLVTWTTL